MTAPTPVPHSDSALLSTGVRMHYYTDGPQDGRPLVLLHGWPQTAWQFRLTLPGFAAAGYRVIAPDYRGAGHSSRPRLDPGVPLDPRGRGAHRGGYDKWSMAEDVHELLHTHLDLSPPATVLGHDIGGMLAVAYAFRYRDDTRALIFGECPQPGTSVFEELEGDVRMFHFTFHAMLDLPETLVAGHEYEYLQHFYDKLGVRPQAVDTEHYVAAFRQAGALRAGFDLDRAFGQDVQDIRSALDDRGKLAMPVLGTSGERGPFVDHIGRMAAEIATDPQVAIVPDAAHWIAEENPDELVDAVVGFDS